MHLSGSILFHNHHVKWQQLPEMCLERCLLRSLEEKSQAWDRAARPHSSTVPLSTGRKGKTAELRCPAVTSFSAAHPSGSASFGRPTLRFMHNACITLFLLDLHTSTKDLHTQATIFCFQRGHHSGSIYHSLNPQSSTCDGCSWLLCFQTPK